MEKPTFLSRRPKAILPMFFDAHAIHSLLHDYLSLVQAFFCDSAKVLVASRGAKHEKICGVALNYSNLGSAFKLNVTLMFVLFL